MNIFSGISFPKIFITCIRLRFRESELPSVLLGIPWPALRGPLRNHFRKKRRPQLYWGGETYGDALEASSALNCRVWGVAAVLSRGIPGKALRAVPGSFRNFFRNFFREVPAVLGVRPRELHAKMVWELLSWKISFQLHKRMFSESILQSQGTFDHDRNLQFQLDFLNFLQWMFFIFLQGLCAMQKGDGPNMSRKWPDFRGEKNP